MPTLTLPWSIWCVKPSSRPTLFTRGLRQIPPKTVEAKIQPHFRESNAHAFAQHHSIVRSIIQQLFEDDPTDPTMTRVKARVFNVTMGKAIMIPSHPFLRTLRREFVPPSEFLQFCSPGCIGLDGDPGIWLQMASEKLSCSSLMFELLALLPLISPRASETCPHQLKGNSSSF
jgi:hypothetical protein